MKNNDKKESSIRFVSKALKLISENVDLHNPESVKHLIAQRNGSNGYKKNLCLAYKKFCETYNIEWTRPLYKQNHKPIRIPTCARSLILPLLFCPSQSSPLVARRRIRSARKP